MVILIIEDDSIINDGVSEFLQSEGYTVLSAMSGEEGLDLWDDNHIDLVLLDIMLPGIDGLSVLHTIKESSEVPVIMLTAPEDEPTQLEAFNGLCDDYISKPFSLMLLKKRIETVLRRTSPSKSVWMYHDAQVDFEAYEARLGEQRVSLTTKEFEVLQCLVANSGRALTRSQIMTIFGMVRMMNHLNA